VGGAIEPVLGGLLNERTGNITSAFYTATVLQVALPESITQDAMVHARHRYADELASSSMLMLVPSNDKFWYLLVANRSGIRSH
jgi:hypothetical protein